MTSPRTLFALTLTAALLALASGSAFAQTTSSVSATQASGVSQSTDLSEGNVFGALALDNAAGSDIDVSDVSDQTRTARSASTLNVERDLARDDVFLALALGAGGRDRGHSRDGNHGGVGGYAGRIDHGHPGMGSHGRPVDDDRTHGDRGADMHVVLVRPMRMDTTQPAGPEAAPATTVTQPGMAACPTPMDPTSMGQPSTMDDSTACPSGAMRPVVLVMMSSDGHRSGMHWSLLGRSLDYEDAGFTFLG